MLSKEVVHNLGTSALDLSERPAHHDWLFAGVSLGIGAVGLSIIFYPELVAAIHVWVNSTAFNHCFLVLPVVAYLVWERRSLFSLVTLRPSFRIALLVIPVAAGWIIAERLGVMEGRQLMAMTVLQIMLASVLGFPAWRAFAMPLMYLYFLVPFGEVIVPILQQITVHFMAAGLDLVGIPNFVDGLTVQIPEGTFEVGEACAGFRFFIATVAFGVLYAWLMFTSVTRRFSFIVFAICISVVANGGRAFGIVFLGHYIGPEAVEIDHVSWGWYFFSLVSVALILAALPFRQDKKDDVAEVTSFTVRPMKRGLGVACVVAGVLFAVGPRLLIGHLERSGARQGSVATLEWPALPDCVMTAAPPSGLIRVPDDKQADIRSQVYHCGEGNFMVTLYHYSPFVTARPLLTVWREVSDREGWVSRRSGTFSPEGGRNLAVWQVAEATRVNESNAVAAAIWLNSKPSFADFRARLDQALNPLRSSAGSPVLALVTQESVTANSSDAWRRMLVFLEKTSPISEAVARFTRMDADG